MRNVILFGSALGIAMLVGLPLAGCEGGDDGTGGKGGDGGGGGDPGVTVDEACKSLASAVCGHLSECSPFLIEVTYGDQATCEGRVVALCDDPTELDSSNVTAEVIAACADAYKERTCDLLLAGAPEECAVPGDKDNGATCAAPSQCKGNLCQAETEGSCGTCASALAEGDPCTDPNDVCDSGLYCASSGKCQKTAGMGELCDVDNLCAPHLSCNFGACGAPLEEGEDCSNGEACNFAHGLICFGLGGSTCTKLGVAKLGEKCGLDMDTGAITTCDATSKCNDQDTCVARPVDGEACTIDPDSGNGDCVTGYDCIGGKCTAGLPECN